MQVTFPLPPVASPDNYSQQAQFLTNMASGFNF